MAQDFCGNTSYVGLVLLAALVSIEIARQLSTEQIELLSAFFEVLGDNLDLLASMPPQCQSKKWDEDG